MWSILNHLDKLNILSQLSTEYVCECPVCGGRRLTISKGTGAYSCWTTECPTVDIRAALGDNSHALTRNWTPKKYYPAVIDKEIELAMLASSVQPDLNEETWYNYGHTCRVHRYRADGQKFTIPYCDGIRGKGKRLWLPYRSEEISQASGKWILGVEGEKCVEYARSLGLVATTWQGSSWTPVNFMATITILKSVGVQGMVYWSDLDVPGFRKAQKLWQTCALPVLSKDKFPLVVVDPRRVWEGITEGQDVADWVQAGVADVERLQTVANKMKNVELRFQ